MTDRQRTEPIAALQAGVLDELDQTIEQLACALNGYRASSSDLSKAARRTLDRDALLLLGEPASAGNLRAISASLHVLSCVERIRQRCVLLAPLVAILRGSDALKLTQLGFTLELIADSTRDQLLAARAALAMREVAAVEDLAVQARVMAQVMREFLACALAARPGSEAPDPAVAAMEIVSILTEIADEAVEVGEQAALICDCLFLEIAN